MFARASKALDEAQHALRHVLGVEKNVSVPPATREGKKKFIEYRALPDHVTMNAHTDGMFD